MTVDSMTIRRPLVAALDGDMLAMDTSPAPAPPAEWPPIAPSRSTAACSDAFAPLLAYDTRLYYTALRILQDHDDARDAVQNTYLRAFKGFHHFRGDAHPFTWLSRITINECTRRGQQRATRRRREIELPVMEQNGTEPSAEDAAFRRIDLSGSTQAIRNAVRDLPPIYRSVVTLRYFDHMSYREVADVSGCRLGTVKSRLARAHEKLQERLAPVLLSEFA